MPLNFRKEILKYLGVLHMSICILKKIKEKYDSERDKCWCECSKENPCAVLAGL